MDILVIDDDSSLRQNIATILRGLGHTVFEASSGREAIQLLVHTETIFSAVITDVQMPGGSGIDVLQCMWRARKIIPTYVHSSAATFCFTGGEPLHLAKHIPQTFTFASFTLKNADTMANIREFVSSIAPLPSI